MLDFIVWYTLIGGVMSLVFIYVSNRANISIPHGGPLLVLVLWPIAVIIVAVAAIRKVLER